MCCDEGLGSRARVEVFWNPAPRKGVGVGSTGLRCLVRANREAKGMPTFRLPNNTNLLKSQPKKLVE
jgi:hypothetical protein